MAWIDDAGITHEADEDEDGGGEFEVAFSPDFDLSETGLHEIEPLPDVDNNTTTDDTINPSYYRQGKMECIDAIEGLGLQFHEAQVLKYIVRWRQKGGLEDLLKARWYLNRLIWSEHSSIENPIQ